MFAVINSNYLSVVQWLFLHEQESGISFVKTFRADVGPTYKTLSWHSDQRFSSWLAFVVLTVVTFVNEVIAIFLRMILFADTAVCVFCSLLGLVSHCFWQHPEKLRFMPAPGHAVHWKSMSVVARCSNSANTDAGNAQSRPLSGVAVCTIWVC